MEKRQIKAKIRILTICCAVLFLSSFVFNESWGAEKKFPNRPIIAVVPYGPGSTDVALRPHVEKMAEQLGEPINFIYKPGATGTVGGTFVARSKPDGYTLVASSQGPVILGPLTKEGIEYSYEDFAPICQMVISQMFLAVKTESPLKTLNDVITAAKASPGKLTYSTSGVFSTPHFAMELFQKAAGVKLTHVPTTGSGPAATALLGGHVQLCAADVGPFAPHVAAGTIRLIAVFNDKRARWYPDIPTFLEFGYRVVYPAWFGLLAPKGTPKEVIDTLYGAAKTAYDKDRNYIEEKLKLLGSEISFSSSPDDFDKSNREQVEMVKALFKEIKGK